MSATPCASRRGDCKATSSLPCPASGNWSQRTATVSPISAVLSAGTICNRLPLVATTGSIKAPSSVIRLGNRPEPPRSVDPAPRAPATSRSLLALSSVRITEVRRLRGLDQSHGQRHEGGADQDRACPRELGAGGGPARLADSQVEEEAAGLSQHSCEQHTSRDPFRRIGEVGARQVEQVDE
jgi:hypothetical protein